MRRPSQKATVHIETRTSRRDHTVVDGAGLMNVEDDGRPRWRAAQRHGGSVSGACNASPGRHCIFICPWVPLWPDWSPCPPFEEPPSGWHAPARHGALLGDLMVCPMWRAGVLHSRRDRAPLRPRRPQIVGNVGPACGILNRSCRSDSSARSTSGKRLRDPSAAYAWPGPSARRCCKHCTAPL